MTVLDLAIRGGLVVDGTGTPARRADIGIAQGRIVSVGDTDSAARTVDADGLVVAPGFVDLHTHFDAQLFWDPAATPSTLHGVTTVAAGNCGFSLAPLDADGADYVRRMMARVEGMPLAALEAGVPWDWRDFGEYLDRLDGRIAVNAGFLVGHSTLRRAVMGRRAVGERATPDDVERMARSLHEALSAGALGFSTSTAPTHNDGDGDPVPSRSADRDELMALAAAVRDHPGTTLELILAGTLNGFSEDEVALMTALSRAADRPINWNVLGVSARDPERHRHQLEASDRAAAGGATVVALTLPFLMRLRLSFRSGFVLEALPGWRDTFALPLADRRAALRDPAVRDRLREGAASASGTMRFLSNWKRMEIVETFAPENAGLAGRTLGEVVAQRGGDVFDTLLDIVDADDLRTGLLPPVADDDDASWQMRAEVWRDQRTVIGGSDAGAHLDMMCGSILTTALLGDAVRRRGLLSLEEAVRQVTDVPARLYGLADRGRVEEGWCADLVLFDPDTVDHGPIHTRSDLPGGAERLYAEAVGIDRVLVNGREIVVEGKPTGDQPGVVFRSGRDTRTVRAGA